MTVQILSRFSDLLYDRPFPTRLGVLPDGVEMALNHNANDPGLYFADNTSGPTRGLIKVGPTHVGSTAPNLTPTGYTSYSKGESWLDESSTKIFKVYDGSTFQTTNAVASVSSGKPSNPINGQLHYDSAIPGLFIYLTSSANWVAV